MSMSAVPWKTLAFDWPKLSHEVPTHLQQVLSCTKAVSHTQRSLQHDPRGPPNGCQVVVARTLPSAAVRRERKEIPSIKVMSETQTASGCRKAVS